MSYASERDTEKEGEKEREKLEKYKSEKIVSVMPL